MEAYNLETEFPLYWSKLTYEQKESVFSVVRNVAEANEKYTESVPVPEEVMEAIRKDREDYMNGIWQTYTREEAREYILRSYNKK